MPWGSAGAIVSTGMYGAEHMDLDHRKRVSNMFETKAEYWQRVYGESNVQGQVYLAREQAVIELVERFAPGGRVIEIGCNRRAAPGSRAWTAHARGRRPRGQQPDTHDDVRGREVRRKGEQIAQLGARVIRGAKLVDEQSRLRDHRRADVVRVDFMS